MNTIKEIFKNLEGHWSLNREIVDIMANSLTHAMGKVVFIKGKEMDSNILNYVETGVLLINESKKINFTKKYIYQLTNDAIHIILDDGVTKGELFQTLIHLGDTCSFVGTEHICKNDKHNGKYHFTNEHEFSIEYVVKGPNMNFQIKSIYTRIMV